MKKDNDIIYVYRYSKPEEIGFIIKIDDEQDENIMVQWETHSSWHYGNELIFVPDA